MTQDSTRTALEDLLSAFMQNDHARLAARYHDDIDWLFHAPVPIFPFAGARRGKAAVLKGFALLYQAFQITGYSVKVKMVEGDSAATLADSQMLQRATGRTIHARIASFHRFQGGKVIEYRGFTDSFDSVEQALGRELAL